MMRLLAAFAAVILSSCAGYQLGGVKPKSLANIKTLSVPMFQNDTQHPRAEALATSSVVHAIGLDGTYRVTSFEKADAILEGRIHKIEYVQLRGLRLDTLRPLQLQTNVTIIWTLKDANIPGKILANGSVVGSTEFFVDANLQTSRNNALPDALERAADSLVSRIANGY